MNSLGARSDRNISIKYRSCDISYIGKLDLCTCSASSPGLSGAISPFAKTDRLWFNMQNEAESMDYKIHKAVSEYNATREDIGDMVEVKYNEDTLEDYYNGKYSGYTDIRKFTLLSDTDDDAIDDNGQYVVEIMEPDEVLDL